MLIYDICDCFVDDVDRDWVSVIIEEFGGDYGCKIGIYVGWYKED